MASSGLTQTNLMQYGYREDGLRTKLAFADGTTADTMTWSRKPSGRVQTIADGSGQAAHTITYNFEGMISQDQMASGTISGFTWDNEGEINGFTDPAGAIATISYTVRGEFRQQYYGQPCTSPVLNPPSNPEYGSITEKSANGFMKADDCATTAPDTSWDPHTGAGLGNNTTTYAYDSAGRQTSTTVNWTRTVQCGDQTCDHSGTDVYGKTYDAENHLLSSTFSGGGGAFDNSSMAMRGCTLSYQPETQNYDFPGFSYLWGPNGHPMIMNGNTVHWDGDVPLFVTDGTGAVKEVKIETAAYYAPGSPIKYLDRNQSGFVVASHWAGGHTAYTPADTYHQTCDSQDFSGAVLYEPGIDGVSDGVNIIQGVRAYDPVAGQWSSPDVYAGDVRDPMSRKSFMWNGNNPYQYSDPSGYIVCAGCTQEEQAQLHKWSDEMKQLVTAAANRAAATGDTKSAARLKHFAKDLSWGNAAWKVTPGSPRGAYGSTSFQVAGNKARSMGTTLDFAKMAVATDSQRSTVLAREGGINEIMSGGAGDEAERTFVQVWANDESRGQHQADIDGAAITNRLYNQPIGVPNAPY